MNQVDEGSSVSLPSAPLEACLVASLCVNADHPTVLAFVDKNKGTVTSQRAQAVSLYYAVRDQFPYDPYRIDFSPAGMSASRVLENGYGHCIAKAALLAACTRSRGIPTRLGFADVQNHLTSKRLKELMDSDVFAWHGYAEMFLDGKWIKATPAFDAALCERASIRPLEFTGLEDSIYHPFDATGRKHMEYLRQRGTYVDIPLAEIVATYIEMYPKAVETYLGSKKNPDVQAGDFANDVGSK
jgi:transglutaminase-like putative cysteine protease